MIQLLQCVVLSCAVQSLLEPAIQALQIVLLYSHQDVDVCGMLLPLLEQE